VEHDPARSPDPQRGEEALAGAGEEPAGGSQPGPSPSEGEEKLARLGDEPRDPDRPGADPREGREKLAGIPETEDPQSGEGSGT
jgi:hypothetical protein